MALLSKRPPRAIEDMTDLVNAFELDIGGKTCWCLLNAKESVYQFVFGWKVTPFHISSTDDQTMRGLESALKELVSPEQITVDNVITSGAHDRLSVLDPLIEKAPIESKFVFMSDRKLALDQAAKGKRRPKSTHVFLTYTVEETDKEDTLSTIASRLENLWNKRFTEKDELDQQRHQIDLLNGAHERFLFLDQLISSKIRLKSEPLDGDAIWSYLWQKVNGDLPTSGLPNWIRFDGKNFEECGKRDIHIASALFPHRVEFERNALYLRGRQRYVAVLTFEELPDGWVGLDGRSDKQQRDRYLWDAVASNPELPEVDIVTQFTWANPRSALKELEAIAIQNRQVARDADAKDKMDKRAEIASEDSEVAMESVLRGDFTVNAGIAIIVYGQSQKKLKAAIRHVQSRFYRPATIITEPDLTGQIWLQTLPILAKQPLYAQPQDFRHEMNISAAPGFCQLLGISGVLDAIELLAESGDSVSLSLENEVGSPKSGAIFGRAGSGKSAFASIIIALCHAKGWPITITDRPKGAKSSLHWLVEFLGGAIYEATPDKPNNILERLDTRNIDPKKVEANLGTFFKNVKSNLSALVLDNRQGAEPLPLSEIDSILDAAIAAFYEDKQIVARFEAAEAGGLNSEAWADTPTLWSIYGDMPTGFTTPTGRLDEDGQPDNTNYGFFDWDFLELDSTKSVRRAVKYIRNRLLARLRSPLGASISAPSAYLADNPITLFSLKDLSSDTSDEGLLMSLSAQALAVRRSLSCPRSVYYVDEASVQLGFDGIANGLGDLFAIHRGMGISIIIALQEPGSIVGCPAKDRILGNLTFRLVGRVNAGQPTELYMQTFNYPHDVISRNSERDFIFSQTEGYSPWLLDDDGILTHARYYPGAILKALFANNKPEQERRQQYSDKYPDKFVALSKFAADLLDINTKGLKIDTEAPLL